LIADEEKILANRFGEMNRYLLDYTICNVVGVVRIARQTGGPEEDYTLQCDTFEE